MGFFLSIIVTMLVLMVASYAMKSVHVKSWSTAFFVALLIGILNPTIGWILALILNIATLGLFWLIGLGFIIRLIVFAIVIKIVDKFVTGFSVIGFGSAFLLALFISLTGSIFQLF